MRLDDPDRPQTGERPAWRDAPQIVVPALQVAPDGEGWAVLIYLPSELKRFAFAPVTWTCQSTAEMAGFLDAWREDPEQCCETFFGKPAPRGRGWHPSEDSGPKNVATTGKSLNDLGL